MEEPRWKILGRRVIDRQYLIRYTLLKTPWFGLYLHHFLGSDPEPLLHDHPWQFASLMLWGGYCEVTQSRFLASQHSAEWIGAGRLLLRAASHRHRIVLATGATAWTLMLTGRRRGTWGFYSWDNDFIAWRQYIQNKELGVEEGG